VVLVVRVMVVGVRGLLTVLDCLTAGVELEVVAVRVVDAGLTVGVALRLAARLELEVVGVRVVEAGCASTTALALQNNNAQVTSTTAITMKPFFSPNIPIHLER
jgi:hypothetical protein